MARIATIAILVLVAGAAWARAPKSLATSSPGAKQLTAKQLAAKLDRTHVPVDGPPPRLTLPTPVRMKLATGGDLLVVERHGVPMAALSVVWKVGAATGDPAAQPGLAGLTLNLLDEGTTQRSALQLASDLEAIGARLDTWSSWDASGVSLVSTTRALDRALALLADVLTAPAFDAQELERLRTERVTAIVQMRDSAGQVAGNVLAALLYGDARYGRPLIGTVDGVRAITREQVLRFHRARLRPSAATVIVVGDVKPESVKAAIDRALAGWRDADGEVPPLVAAPAPVGVARRALVDKPGAPQTELRVGEPSVPRNHPDFFPLLVMNTLLGGNFSSRLNTNLREKHGYTYGVRSELAFRRDGGPFAVAAPVKTEVTAPSLALVREELAAIRDRAPDERELRLGKDQLERALARRFETDLAVANELGLLAVFDLPADYWSTYAAKVEAVTAADVQRVAREQLDLGRMSIVLVGDRARIEADAAQLAGAFEHLDSDGKPLAPQQKQGAPASPPKPAPAATGK